MYCLISPPETTRRRHDPKTHAVRLVTPLQALAIQLIENVGQHTHRVVIYMIIHIRIEARSR